MNSQLNARLEALDEIQNIGPFELSLFERMEENLAIEQNASSKMESNQTERSSVKYTKSRQVLHVSGWIDLKTVYSEHIVNLVFKFLMGCLLFIVFRFNRGHAWPLFLACAVFWFGYMLYYVVQLVLSVGSHSKIK